jgi:hypothetical protein
LQAQRSSSLEAQRRTACGVCAPGQVKVARVELWTGLWTGTVWAVDRGGARDDVLLVCEAGRRLEPSGTRNLEARRRGSRLESESRLWLSRTARVRRYARGNGTAAERGAGAESREPEGLGVLLPWQQHLEGVDVQGGRAEQTSIITTPPNHGQRLERLGPAPATPTPCHAMVTVVMP